MGESVGGSLGKRLTITYRNVPPLLLALHALHWEGLASFVPPIYMHKNVPLTAEMQAHSLISADLSILQSLIR